MAWIVLTEFGTKEHRYFEVHEEANIIPQSGVEILSISIHDESETRITIGTTGPCNLEAAEVMEGSYIIKPSD